MNDSQRFWSKQCVRWAAVAVVALGLASVAFHLWQRKLVDRQLQAIRAAGEPVTRADLEWFYPALPPEKDTTQLWLAAFALLEQAMTTDGEADRELPFVGGGYADGLPLPGQPFPHLKVAERYLERRAEALERIQQAVALGGAARYPISSDHSELFFPELGSQLRATARVLSLRAFVDAHCGNNSGAADALCAALSMVHSVDGAPDGIIRLVAIGVTGVAVNLFLELSAEASFSDRDLRRFQSLLRGLSTPESLWAAQCGDRVWKFEAVNETADLTPVPEYFRVSPLWWGNVDAMLEHMAESVAAVKHPLPDALSKVEEIQNRMNRRKRLLYELAQILVSSDALYMNAVTRCEARTCGLDAAIGVRLFRRARGRLPQRLDELVPEYLPEIPIDPYSGGPVRYRIADGRYVIYSVGRDGKDDGGYDKDRLGEPDIAVEIRSSKRRR